MAYTVVIKRKVSKGIEKLPTSVRDTFQLLHDELRDEGPIQKEWSHFGALRGGDHKYHCHLSGSYIACWTHEKKTLLIEVNYVGSHEGAPY